MSQTASSRPPTLVLGTGSHEWVNDRNFLCGDEMVMMAGDRGGLEEEDVVLCWMLKRVSEKDAEDKG